MEEVCDAKKRNAIGDCAWGGGGGANFAVLSLKIAWILQQSYHAIYYCTSKLLTVFQTLENKECLSPEKVSAQPQICLNRKYFNVLIQVGYLLLKL